MITKKNPTGQGGVSEIEAASDLSLSLDVGSATPLIEGIQDPAASDEIRRVVATVSDSDRDVPPTEFSRAGVEIAIVRCRVAGTTDRLRIGREALWAINALLIRENECRIMRKVARLKAEGASTKNVKLGNDEKVYAQRSLTASDIAQLMLRMEIVINIAPTGRLSNPDFDLLAVYDNNPTSLSGGTYLTSESALTRVARRYNSQLSINDMKELMAVLKEQAPRRDRDTHRDLIAVANGIVNYQTKELMAFTPDHIFTSKLATRYIQGAPNPVIHNDADGTDWDVESWINDLSDDPELVELLWQIIGATVRPYVSWNKSAWFYSEQGNNGKGSVVEMIRNLMGPQAHTSIPLSDFSKDFALEPLTQASAILVDENDVGTFIDKAANLKAVVTGDVISINRKFRTPISYQFRGFMIQCLNEFPKIKDRSESFYRRQLFIPFHKCFTGAERKYIKDDYLSRPEVLEYVLWRVINMEDYYDFRESEAAQWVLAEYKEFNDPVRAFWNEFSPQFQWDLIPFTFAYDLYKKWLTEAMPSSTPLGRNTFIKDLVAIAGVQPRKFVDEYLSGKLNLTQLSSLWSCESTSQRHQTSSYITSPEPLIAEHELSAWENPIIAKGSEARNMPIGKDFYSGLLRADRCVRKAIGEDKITEIENERLMTGSITPRTLAG